MFSESNGLIVNFVWEKNDYQHISLWICKKNQILHLIFQHQITNNDFPWYHWSNRPPGPSLRDRTENKFISVRYSDRLQSAIQSKSRGHPPIDILLRAITFLIKAKHTAKIIDMKPDDQIPPYVYINKIQQDATLRRYLFAAKLLYMFRVSIAPNIRST